MRQRLRMVGPYWASFSGLAPRMVLRASRVVGAAWVMLRRTVSERMKKVGRPAALAASRRQSFRRVSRVGAVGVSAAGGGGGVGRLFSWTAEVWMVLAAGLSTSLRSGRDDKGICFG